jgi:hypothetical protein
LGSDDEVAIQMKRLISAFLATIICVLIFVVPAYAQVISQAELGTLVEMASRSGMVEDVETVSSTAADAQSTLNPHTSPTSSAEPSALVSTPVAVVVMHGHFVDGMAKVPPHAEAPSGDILAYTVNQLTGRVAALYVGDSAPSLAGLGGVERLTTASDKATISRANRRFAVASHHRVRGKVATWGDNCKYVPSEDHCWATAEWDMTKTGEEIEGAESFQTTTTMSVPGWEDGYFVDNEEWTILSKNEEKWEEVGQQGGEYKGCCSLWWFYAVNYGPNEYYQYVDAPYVWEVGLKERHYYATESVEHNGTWCVDTSGNGLEWLQDKCFSGFSVYSKKLEAGVEVATESKPGNAASVLVNGQHLNGYYYGWNEGYEQSTTPGLCVSYIGPTLGDIDYGTC